MNNTVIHDNTKWPVLQGLIVSIQLILFTFPCLAQDVSRPEPESPVQYESKSAATGARFMIATAHPEATQAGYEVLAKGGSAADAAIAAQMMLGLVEPQSSGIGGGSFILYYNAAKGQLVSIDGRETAPATAGKHLFTGDDGKPMAFMDAVVGGRSVGVPGTVRALEKLYKWYGRLPWASLFDPAIQKAENGFTVSTRLSAQVKEHERYLKTYTDTKLYFFPDVDNPVEAGDTLQNKKYASVLRGIALQGSDALHTGEIAQDIIKSVREIARDNPGLLSMEDLAQYEAKERAPVCGSYRLYTVCSMGEPSSGGLTLLSILGMVEYFNLRALGPDNPKSWHIIGEASRLAFADRDYYMADPDKERTPGSMLIDKAYLKSRSRMIQESALLSSVSHGVPAEWKTFTPLGPDVYIKRPGTTHISIVDTYGNILSMTSSIEGAFGSQLMAQGFLLNSQLTDFSFDPDKDGKPVANKVAGGKRPRSSMAPTIVFDPQGKPFMVIGTAGGSRIIGFIAQRIIAAIDWQMGLQEALNMPSILNRGKEMEVEEGAQDIARELEKMGHPVIIEPMSSGLSAIQFINGQIIGAADPRREGVALGE